MQVPNFRIVNGTAQLNKEKHWYHQIQGELRCSGRAKCILFVYTSKWNSGPIVVERDDVFWEREMAPKLIT